MTDNSMKIKTLKKYLLNCFLLTIPIMIWNIIFTSKLPQYYQPEIFWKDIPVWLEYFENISRILILYIGGTLIYFASWLVLIYFPNSSWSSNIFGFMAPAYTPLLWLTGIGFVGNSFYFNLPYKRCFFILIVIIFLILHNFHTMTIYFRIH
jgi:hypothetical protein